MASIKSSVTELPGPDAEVAIVQQFWGRDLAKGQTGAYKSYFRYYSTECRRVQMGISKESWLVSTMAAATHAQILLVAEILSLEQHLRRPKIRASLRKHFHGATDEALNRSIDFALRTWLTLNVREQKFSLHTPRTPTIEWNDEISLAEFVRRNFPAKNLSIASVNSKTIKFDETFTIANMNRLSGVDVEWTPFLMDHLTFDKNRRIVKIYPFKQVLLDQLELWEQTSAEPKSANRTLIPKDVLRETLISLNLLFPPWDLRTHNYMLQHDLTFHREGSLTEQQVLDLKDFVYWGDRLLELYHVFNMPTMGLKQFWHDRRDPQQWYNFWVFGVVIVLLTVFFGVISALLGVLQTAFAYEALKLARLQAAHPGGAG